MKYLKNPIWKWIGLVVTSLLVVVAWYYGFFFIIFYLLGLYAALYFVSLLFKTTKIIGFILTVGIILTHLFVSLFYLYLLYLALKVMFTENFLFGLLAVLFGLPLVHAIVMGFLIALVSPLFWFQGDLEKRFETNTQSLL